MVRRPDDSDVIVDVIAFSEANDYDILLQNDKGWFWTHKSVLSRWSPFFERVFNSKFSVASSPTFELDEEEDMVTLKEKLKYMYGSHDYQTLPVPDYRMITITDEELVARLDYCLRVYTITDKYDCPALRAEVFAEFFHLMWHQVPRLAKYAILIPFLGEICGLEAPFFADGDLYVNVAAFCERQAWNLQQHEEYVELMHSGLSLNIQRYVVAENLAWMWDNDSDSERDSDDYDDEYPDAYDRESRDLDWGLDWDSD